jgi:hypothetical protein
LIYIKIYDYNYGDRICIGTSRIIKKYYIEDNKSGEIIEVKKDKIDKKWYIYWVIKR